jgi:SAM-dependent methyltransferase
MVISRQTLTVAVTVLCHVPERDAVLREMARVTRHGGTVLIVDGEYAANQVSHPDVELTARVIDGWRAGAIDNPHLMRRIVTFVQAAGLDAGAANGYVHVEAGQVDEATSFIWQWALFASRTAVAAETITQTEADRWIHELHELNQRSELFGSVTYVGMMARKP